MRTSIGTAAAALATALLVVACTDAGSRTASPDVPPATLGAIRLVAYTGCDDMLAGLREATVKNVGPWGIGPGQIFTATGRSADGRMTADAKSAVPGYSTTNVHEAGVDEPDLVKTDGERIITYARGVLRVVDAASRKVTAGLRLVPADKGYAPANLLVHGDRALVLFTEGGMVPFGDRAMRPAARPGPQYTLVDLKEMKILASMATAGSHVDARMIGSTVRIVVRSQPEIAFTHQPGPDEPEAELIRRNQEIVRAAPVDAWLPTWEITGPRRATTKHKVACERVRHPRQYSGTSMLTVHTVELEAGFDGDEPISVAADGDTVYATPTSMYVTSNPRWGFRNGMIDDTPPPPPTLTPATPVTPAGTDLPATPGASGSAVAPGQTGATVTPGGNASAVAPGQTGAPVTPGGDGSTVAPKDPPSTPPAEKIEPSDDPSMPSLLPKPTATMTPTPPDASPAPTLTSTPAPSAATPSASPSWTPSGAPNATAAPEPPEQTEVHRFDISGAGVPEYVASGAVPGRLLNHYALSEYEGNLRIATTTFDGAGVATGRRSSAVYVLDAGTLSKVGEVTGLGAGERIYSVRFIGPVGYLVTFRQVDPLYTLDLRDPAAPKVTGELKITGFSAYLHPAGDGRLIGVGQEASEEGRTLGTQISLFDVSDPAKPARLARFHQEKSGSEAEWDPHAFLYWPATGLAMLPLGSWGGHTDDYRTAALVLKVTDDSITSRGTITHPKEKSPKGFAPATPTIQRCLIVGDTLWTLSDSGLKASDATTLADRSWIPFTG
ncbi:beta-propeller domain-containing protein [Sphaerisporangium rhizosphaerae]|uniref:Beta-propeller domain-containing protein n=1 Tax=Sphaerisporangium rhizosphaerae TaxID=2269375 RepID=A0ABW2P120_9ACTN